MVVLISGISLAGYVALRFAGQRYGIALPGVLGGLASSTATTLVHARHSKGHSRGDEGLSQLAVVVILLANLVMLVKLSIASAVVLPAILPQLLPVLGSGLVVKHCRQRRPVPGRAGFRADRCRRHYPFRSVPVRMRELRITGARDWGNPPEKFRPIQPPAVLP